MPVNLFKAKKVIKVEPSTKVVVVNKTTGKPVIPKHLNSAQFKALLSTPFGVIDHIYTEIVPNKPWPLSVDSGNWGIDYGKVIEHNWPTMKDVYKPEDKSHVSILEYVKQQKGKT